jgi:hypothetical protein
MMMLPDSSQVGRRRLLGSALAALALHLCLLALLISGNVDPGANASAELGEIEGGSATAVYLVRSEAAVASIEPQILALQSTEAAESPPTQIAQDLPPMDARADAPLTSSEAAGAGGPSQSEASRQSRGAGGQSTQFAAKIIDPMALASLPIPVKPGESPLWPQVSHCWKGIGPSSAVYVVVRIDARGQVDGSPLIFRPGAPRDAEPTPEEQSAVRALFSCAPYSIPTGGQHSFNILFGTASG